MGWWFLSHLDVHVNKSSQKRSVGIFLYITRYDGKKVDSIAVHSHEEAWVTSQKLKDDPKIQIIEAKIK